MKKIKNYNFEYKYIKEFLENNNENVCIDIDDTAIVFIESCLLKNRSYDINIFKDKNKQEKLFYFNTNENFSLLLKGIGKITILSELLINMPIGETLIVDDKNNDKIGFTKLETMNNVFIIAGGFNNWSVLWTIDNISFEKKKYILKYDIFKYLKDYCSLDYRTMFLLMNKNIASTMKMDYIAKPYILIN